MTTTPLRVHAGIYCRISDDRNGTGLGVERQRTECTRLAADLGWNVIKTYTDNDISAFTGKRRPEYQRLLADIAAGSVTGVITWHPDRLNRSPVELERLIDVLERNSVAVASVTAGFFDLGTASGRAVARTLSAWARFESEHKSERIKAQVYQKALTGAPSLGGRRPFGYEADRITVIPAEAKVIRDLMRRLLRGESTNRLRMMLQATGSKTTEGNDWSTGGLARMLMGARIAGWRSAPMPHGSKNYFGGPFLVRAQWPAIVSRADVERARTILSDETLRAGSTRRWLLSGIALCSGCGRGLMSSYPDTVSRRYNCVKAKGVVDRCGKISISHRIEDDVTERLIAAVDGGLIRRIVAAGATAFAPTIEESHAASRRLHELGQERDDGLIDSREWLIRRNRIGRRSASAQATAQSLTDLDVVALSTRASSFRDAWNAFNTRDKRAVVRVLTRHITVVSGLRGGHTYNPSRVHVVWRA